MADVQISVPQVVAAPSTYLVADAAEFVLKCVNADFDGAGAAGAWLPCVTIKSDSGHVVARAVDQGVSVAAGGSAEVSWFPRLTHRGAAAAVPDCVLLGSGNGTSTLTITLTAPVPRNGVLQVVYTQATIGNANDTNSAPTATNDSKGRPGWTGPWAGGTPPNIGLTRQTNGPGPPNTTSQVGSVVRPAVAGDLVAGDTITVTFGTLSPALFHTAGLVIWQHCFFEGIKNNFLIRYGEGDSYDDFSADPTTLSWDTDYGPGIEKADRDAIMLTALGAYPAVAGVTPFNGTRIGDLASGSVSIAAVCTDVAVGAIADMGGVWPSAATQLMGNFQLVYPRTFS